MVTTTEDRLLTRQEAAEFLTLRPQTLAAWSMSGRHLPVIRVGRSVRYRQSELEEYLKRQTVPASS